MLVRAVPLIDFLATARSTTAIGTAYSTVAPVTGQRVFAALHLTSASAVSTARVLVGSIQAASSSGFSPLTTEIFFALTSSEGSTWSYATPSTDRMWRRAALTMSTAASTANTWKGLIWAGIK